MAIILTMSHRDKEARAKYPNKMYVFKRARAAAEKLNGQDEQQHGNQKK